MTAQELMPLLLGLKQQNPALFAGPSAAPELPQAIQDKTAGMPSAATIGPPPSTPVVNLSGTNTQAQAPPPMPTAPMASTPPPDPRTAQLAQLQNILNQRMNQQEPWWQSGLRGMMLGAGGHNPESASLMAQQGMGQLANERDRDIQRRFAQVKDLQDILGRTDVEKMKIDAATAARPDRKKIAQYTGEDGLLHMVFEKKDGSLEEQGADGKVRPYTSRLTPGASIAVSEARVLQAKSPDSHQYLGPDNKPIDLADLSINDELVPFSGGLANRWQVASQRQKTVSVNNVVTAMPALEQTNPAAQVPLGAARVGTVGSHEVPQVDASGNPVAEKLYSTSTPITGPTTSGAPMPQAPGIPVAPATGVSPVQSQPPAPKQIVPPQAGGSRPLNSFQEPVLANQRKLVGPIKTAASQLWGDPSMPDAVEPLTAFAHIADDPEARKRIGTAARLIMSTIGQGEGKSEGFGASIMGYGGNVSTGGILTGVKNALGVNTWLARTEVDKIESAMNELKPDEKRMLNRIFSAYGTIAGLRGLSSGGAYRFSMEAMNRELPIPGIAGVNDSKSYYDKLASLATEVAAFTKNSGISRQLLPEQDDYATKAAVLSRLGRGQNADVPKVNPFRKP